MKIGDGVLYVARPGQFGFARVAAVLTAGASGYKRLDVVTESGRHVSGVPYVADCAVSAGYWCLDPTEVKSVDKPVRRRRLTETVEWKRPKAKDD